MKKFNFCHFLLLFLSCILLSACATVPKTTETERLKKIEPSEETKKEYIPTEQETKSLELFTEILELIESSEDRQSVLLQVEELYDRIIREYPETPLAKESYWKLITIYLEDYSPPAFEKAEARYYEFLEKHPQSILRHTVDDTIGKGYYKNAEWERLLKLCLPSFKEYIEKGKHPSASMMFMYSEANYNLGNLTEAEKGYEIVAELFPKLNLGIKSKTRLEEIRRNRD